MIGLFSRCIVSWSIQSRKITDLALQTFLATVPRLKLKTKVMIYFDQGWQFTSQGWRSVLGKHKLIASINRRGAYRNKSSAERPFLTTETGRIRRRTYTTRNTARHNVSDDVEMFYNKDRKPSNNAKLSPVEPKIKQQSLKETCTSETGVTSLSCRWGRFTLPYQW